MIDAPPQHETEAPQLPATPYVGLVPYTEKEADFFFGRADEVRIVTGNLRAAKLTIVYGASGVGKTSLLEAGVVHDLHEQVRANAANGRAPFAVCSFREWRDDPLPALVETIRTSAVDALGGGRLGPWRPGEPLVDTLRSWTEHVRTLLVVLDQFEDYFLYHPDEDGPATFAGEFPAVVNDPNLRANFVLSLREDAWAKLDRFEGRVPRLFANYVRIEHLSREAAREAIEGPIREWNRHRPDEPSYTVEPALVDAVVQATAAGRLALSAESGDAQAEGASTEAIEAPFLQLVLERLWRATIEAGSTRLTLARLQELGGAEKIVDGHLQQALGTLTRGEEAVAAEVFRYLVTGTKAKIAHPASDLAEWTKRPEPEVSAVLEKLCRGESGRVLRAIQPPGEGEATRYELFHDVLAEPILEWRREYEQRRARRAAVGKVGRRLGIVLLLVLALLGPYTYVNRNSLNHALRRVTSLVLASSAASQVDTRPDVALLLSLEAIRVERQSVQTESSMISAFEAIRSTGATAILHETSPTYSVGFSPDGHTLASANADGTIRLWDISGHRQLGQPLRGHTGPVYSVAFSPDGHTLASAGFDHTIRLWDLTTHRQLGQPLRGHTDYVLGVAFSPDGHTLASASLDQTIRLWDVATQKPLGRPLRGHTDYLESVAFSPNGHILASGGLDRTIRLWDVKTHRQLGQPLDGQTGAIFSVAFSPDGHTLASAGADQSIRLWNLTTHQQLGRPLRGHTGDVESVAFSPDGHTLASAGTDQTIRLWDPSTHRQLGQPLRGHTDTVDSVAFSPDGHTLASASADQTIRLWDFKLRPQLGQPLRGHTGEVLSVAFSPDGHTLASASADHTIRLWDIKTHEQLGQPLRGDSDIVYGVAFSPRGHTLASAGADETVRLWDVATHRQIGQPLRGHFNSVTSVAFSPDGHTLASASWDATIRLWDVATHKQLGALSGHTDGVLGVAFSPDGRTLASASADETVRLWDVRTHRQLGRPFRAHTGPVSSVAFSPDGRTLASTSVDQTIRLWDVTTHRQLGEPLRGHSDTVESVAFSPDGHTLASASGDGTIRLWDVTTHQQLGRPLRGHTGSVYSVTFSPDGHTLASAGADKTARLWEGILWNGFDDVRMQVCSLVWGDLTNAEWEQYAPGIPYHTTCPD